jgi:fibronectin-binding autotransporter adhesin
MNGVDNVFNLGDGGALSVASVRSVSLGSTGAMLTINQGLLQASAAGGLITGSGIVSNTGPAYLATEFDSSIGNTITGPGSLTKQGSGTLTLSGANTYTGDTSVVEGALEITHAYLNDKADVHVARGAHLVLNFNGNDEIGGLSYAGVDQPQGHYCAGALEEAISGSGCLIVTKGPPTQGFHLIVR